MYPCTSLPSGLCAQHVCHADKLSLPRVVACIPVALVPGDHHFWDEDLDPHRQHTQREPDKQTKTKKQIGQS